MWQNKKNWKKFKKFGNFQKNWKSSEIFGKILKFWKMSISGNFQKIWNFFLKNLQNFFERSKLFGKVIFLPDF